MLLRIIEENTVEWGCLNQRLKSLQIGGLNLPDIPGDKSESTFAITPVSIRESRRTGLVVGQPLSCHTVDAVSEICGAVETRIMSNCATLQSDRRVYGRRQQYVDTTMSATVTEPLRQPRVVNRSRATIVMDLINSAPPPPLSKR